MGTTVTIDDPLVPALLPAMPWARPVSTDVPSGAWPGSSSTPPIPAEVEVHQAGLRRLWTELADHLTAWDAAGQSGIERYGLTITPAGRAAHLDRHPGSHLTGPLEPDDREEWPDAR